MIEFLAGVLLGAIAFAVGSRGQDDRGRELARENEQLRDALRRVRTLVRAQRRDSFVANYIDHVLADEAGA